MGKRPDLKPRKRRKPPGISEETGISGADLDYDQARKKREVYEAEFRRLRAERAAADLAVLKSKYHDVEECRVFHAQQFQTVRKRFQSLHRELPPQLYGLEPRQMAPIIEKRVREILQALADGK